MRNYTFMCELPPPYGGVTIKNQVLMEKLFKDMKIIDFCRIKRNPLNVFPIFFKMIFSFIKKDIIIYGFGSKERLKIALRLQKMFAGKKNLESCINIVMGGDLVDEVIEDMSYRDLLSQLKVNFVETKKMQEGLKEYGISNTQVFPNPKTIENSKEPHDNGSILKCVFFSRICCEKGVSYIISEFEKLKGSNVSIDFYGHIDNEIKDIFFSFVRNNDNVRYCGVFDSVRYNVYSKLNEYDILLLPTTWIGEGIPGILVEAKMAGIIPVVSDWRYNSEIVENNKEGIILEDLNKGTLYKSLIYLLNNKEIVTKLKWGSFESRKRYSIESYEEMIKSYLF